LETTVIAPVTTTWLTADAVATALRAAALTLAPARLAVPVVSNVVTAAVEE